MAKKRTKANGDSTFFVELRNNKKYYKGQLIIGNNEEGKSIRKHFCRYDRI